MGNISCVFSKKESWLLNYYEHTKCCCIYLLGKRKLILEDDFKPNYNFMK